MNGNQNSPIYNNITAVLSQYQFGIDYKKQPQYLTFNTSATCGIIFTRLTTGEEYFVFGRKCEFLAMLIHFRYFVECQALSYAYRDYLLGLIWTYELMYFK